ncbi:hypothetical protein AGMMS49959_11540 [Planctomycetales bacterium]|nr:hypothetical protein AGMMS49959_11540 [Planctomycetales bacterium]
MNTAKLSASGEWQTVLLPEGYRFGGTEVGIKKVGEVVYLFPPTAAADIFMRGITGFSADFMENGREQGAQAARQDF